MATHTVHGALTQMFFDSDGAPWTYPKWKEITKVQHGLFPTEDAQLPPGWTREMADFISSYFDQFQRQGSEEKKIAFSVGRKNAAQVPGRLIWRNFITDGFKNWKIHAKVTAVLSEEGIHPLTIILTSKTGSILDWPLTADYIALALSPVGLSLFGEEAININGHLEDSLRRTTRALIHRTWSNIRNQIWRSRNRIATFEEDATKAFDNLDRNNLTKPKIKGVIVKLARWKALAEVLAIPGVMERVEAMEDELQALMLRINPDLKFSNPKAQKASNVSAAALKSLASESDIEEVVNLYLDFFSTPSIEDSEPLQEQRPAAAVNFSDWNNDTDLGVEVESSMSPETLSNKLGFPSATHLPLLFNSFRHKAGLSAWDPANTPLFLADAAVRNEEMDPIALHWHQLAGVHAIIRMSFTATVEPNNNQCVGVLVADEVGLGKTYQAATVIAFLSDVAMRQKMKQSLPPVITHTPYLGEHNVLPRLPHLIVVPGTLLSQWENESKILFKRGSFDILVYGSGKGVRKQFWAPDGPFHASKNDVNKIIIASHSALQQDFSSIYFLIKKKGKLPWDTHRELPSYKSMVTNTLFGQQYLSVTIDEAHAFRNVGAKHSAALLIMKRAVLRIALTATPLQTSTKDVAAMGRLIGIPHFLSELALVDEKNDLSTIRQAKRGMSEDTDSLADDDAIRACTVAIAQRMQGQFHGHILRRTARSRDWQQASLITLPPYVDIQIIVKPTAREMEIISELADRVKESVAASNGLLMIVSRSFYLEHRMAIGFARYNLEENIPKFNSLEEWEPKKSTKMDVCARMCKHLLTRDDVPEITVENGQIQIPPIPPLEPGSRCLQTTKILISQQFPSLGGLLRNILDLYGIKHLSIDGQTSFIKRAKIVEQFSTDPENRVLIMSSVGSVGLNLTAANVIIFLDQPWSSQDELQIRGCAHRQPQKKIVKGYPILADETADIVLSALARGKHYMMEGFLQQDRGQGKPQSANPSTRPSLCSLEMMQLFSGQVLEEEGDDSDQTDPLPMLSDVNSVSANSGSASSAQIKPPRRQKTAKVKTNADADAQVNPNDEGGKQSKKQQGKRGGRKKKGKNGENAQDGDNANQGSGEQKIQDKQKLDIDLDMTTNSNSAVNTAAAPKDPRGSGMDIDMDAEDHTSRKNNSNNTDGTSSDMDDTEPRQSSPRNLMGYPYSEPSTPPPSPPHVGDRRSRFHLPDSPQALMQKKRPRIGLVDYTSSPPPIELTPPLPSRPVTPENRAKPTSTTQPTAFGFSVYSQPSRPHTPDNLGNSTHSFNARPEAPEKNRGTVKMVHPDYLNSPLQPRPQPARLLSLHERMQLQAKELRTKGQSLNASAQLKKVASISNIPQVRRVQPSLHASRSSESLDLTSVHIQHQHAPPATQPPHAPDLSFNGRGSVMSNIGNHGVPALSASMPQTSGHCPGSTSVAASASSSNSNDRYKKISLQARSGFSLPAIRQPAIYSRESDADGRLSPPPASKRPTNPFSKSKSAGKRRAM